MKYVLICFMLLVNVTTLEATERTQKRVLYISSYSYSWETVPAQIRGIEKVLSGKVHIDYEFMDSKLSESAYYQNLFKNKITYRMERVRPYDSIIVGDDPALDFVWHNHVDLFKSTPVVFLGINDLENAAIYHKYADFTGVFEKNDYAASISMACKVNPKAKNIVAILDDTISGKAERRQFYAQAALYPQLSFGDINASKLSRQEFREALSKISKETILMFVICSNDRYGNIYQDYEVEDIIFNHAPVPAYSFNRMGVGDGLFGGRLVSHEKSGEIVGRMVLEILYGKSAKSIKVIDNPPAAYIFDYNIAKKYNIDQGVIAGGNYLVELSAVFLGKQ